MKRRIKALARKFGNFIEKVRLSESDYLKMKEQSEKFEGMMSTCEFKLGEPEIVDIKDAEGNILNRIPNFKNRTASLNVNVEELLKEAGITYSKDGVELNVE